MESGVPFATRGLTEMMATSFVDNSAFLHPVTSMLTPSLVELAMKHPSRLAQYTVQGVKHNWATATEHQLNSLLQPAVAIVLMMSASGVMVRGVTIPCM